MGVFDGKLIAIDFDNTISDYSKGYRGKGVFGPPLPGVKRALSYIRENGGKIIIHTCRVEKEEIIEYLNDNDIPFDYFNYSPLNKKYRLSSKKIRADIYVDDRGLRFTGDWDETLRSLITFRTWNAK